MANDILSRITVLDMTEGVAGPYASTILGDMGANVIKIERKEGDWSRTTGVAGHPEVGSTNFISLNRNKRDLGLDLHTAEGMRIMQRLVARSDVLISNYRAGVMARLGLDYARCRELNEGIVHCAISGFGEEGPYARLPASDTVMQAMSGLMNMVGDADGPPLRVGFPLIDMTAANQAAQAVLLALYGRLAGRGGAQIEISLMAAAAALMSSAFTSYMIDGRLPQRQGNQNTLLAPAGAYRVAEGRFITIAVLRDSHWSKFCAAMDLAVLERDERFRTNALRVVNRAALDEAIVPMFLSRGAEYWLQRLRAADILCSPINTFADIAADPALFPNLPVIDPQLPGIPRAMGLAIRFNGSYFPARRPPPAKGQHSAEILRELGFESHEIEDFFRAGAAFPAAAE